MNAPISAADLAGYYQIDDLKYWGNSAVTGLEEINGYSLIQITDRSGGGSGNSAIQVNSGGTLAFGKTDSSDRNIVRFTETADMLLKGGSGTTTTTGLATLVVRQGQSAEKSQLIFEADTKSHNGSHISDGTAAISAGEVRLGQLKFYTNVAWNQKPAEYGQPTGRVVFANLEAHDGFDINNISIDSSVNALQGRASFLSQDVLVDLYGFDFTAEGVEFYARNIYIVSSGTDKSGTFSVTNGSIIDLKSQNTPDDNGDSGVFHMYADGGSFSMTGGTIKNSTDIIVEAQASIAATADAALLASREITFNNLSQVADADNAKLSINVTGGKATLQVGANVDDKASFDLVNAGSYVYGQTGVDITSEGDISIANGAHIGSTSHANASTAKSDEVKLTSNGGKISADTGAGVDAKVIVVDGAREVILTGAKDNVASHIIGSEFTKITSDVVSIKDGAHIGDYSSNQHSGGSVTLTTSDLTLDNESYITSTGDVTISAKGDSGELSIKMDQTQAGSSSSWIKGNNVTIGSAEDDAKLTIVGGEYAATGSGTVTVNVGAGTGDHASTISGALIGDTDDAIVISGTGDLTIQNEDDKPSIVNGSSVTVTVGSLAVTGSDNGDQENNSHITSSGNVQVTTSDVALNDAGWIQGGSVTVNAGEGDTSLSISGDGSGAITSENGAITVTGGSGSGSGKDDAGLFLDGVKVQTNGSIKLDAAGSGSIVVGAEDETGDTLNKDTQILGSNVTIGSGSGSHNISIEDAQIGVPGTGAVTGSNSSVQINGGAEGAVSISASEIGMANDGNSQYGGSATDGAGTVNIAGGTISIGSANKGTGAGTNEGFDTAIGGSNITIGNTETGSVSIGDAQIGTASEDGKAGSNVTINAGSEGNRGSITIGSAESTGESVINGGNVTIGAVSSNADITINGSRDKAEENASSTDITGDKVVIGNGKGDVSVTGSDIASTGNDGITIEAGDEAELVINDALLDSTGGLAEGTDQFGTGTGTGNVTIIGGGSIAGSGIAAGGNVNFGGSTSDGNKNDHIVNVTGGSSISGNGMSVAGDTTVNLGGAEGTDKGNSVNIAGEGNVTVEGELNIAGGNDIKGEGDLTINTGTTGNGTVNVAEGGSIIAGANGEGETDNTGDMTITGNGTVNVAGGKLEANGDGNSGGNIKVEGGDVNLSDNGSIEADGTVTIGGGQNDASVNVAAGETGTIVSGSNKDEGGNNLVIGNNGTLNVGNDGVDENGNTINEGSLLITNEKDPSSRPSPLPGGMMIDKDTTVAVEDGGHLVSNDITFNEDGKLNIGSGGSIYTDADTIINNVKPDGSGNINIAKPGEDDKGATVQISGTVSAEKGEDGKSELDKINEALQGSGTTIVFDSIDGVAEDEIISEKELNDKYNNNTVIGDAIIDVSGEGGNDLTQGGGGSIMVGPTDESDNTLTIRPDDDNKGVTITGSEKDPNKEIVVGKGEDGKPVTDGTFDIDLEDGADLTLGKDGAAGGTLSGSITATTDDSSKDQHSNVTVNGGNFTVEGGIDLTHPDAEGGATSDDDGKITIYDHNPTNPDAENGLTVAGDVAAGNLEMTGDNTNFDVAGSVDLSGDATLTGGADADVVGSMDVGGDLDLSGTASLGKGEQTSQEAKPDLTVGGNLDITDSASIDRNDVAVNGDAHINGNGGLTADGNFDVAGELQIGTGTDIDGNETEAGNPTVSVSGGNLTTGTPGSSTAVESGNLTIGQGTVNVTGEDGSPDKGNIIVGDNGNGGNLVVGNDGTTPKTPADVSADNNITVENGSATIHDNGHVTAGGAFVVGVGDGSTTVEGAGNATIEGTLSAGTADIGNDLVIGAEVADGAQAPAQNGSVTTSGKTDVAGNLIVNENGQLSVGSNPTGDDGRLTVGGYVDTEAGSNVVANNGLTVGSANSKQPSNIGGSLTIGGTSTEGEPNAEFNGDLTVEAGGSLNNAAVVDGTTDTLVSGNLTVGSADAGSAGASASLGDAEVNGTSTIDNATVDTGKFTGHGDMTVGAGGALNANGGDIILSTGTGADDKAPNLIVNGGSVTAQQQGTGEAAVGGNIAVDGYASVTNGSLTADGKLTISGTDNSGNGFIVGNQSAKPNEDGAYDKTTNVTVGSIEVDGKTQVYGDGTLAVNGNALFTGGLAMGPGANYVNNSDKATTVGGKDGGFTLDAGSSVTTNGAFAFGEEIGDKVGTSNATTSGKLNGTITAGSIDFGAYENTGNGNTITFAGGTTGEGDDATRFEAGFETGSLTGNVALSNGANAVLTPSADGKAPVVNGFITVADGDAEKKILGNTLTTNAANKGDYSNADVTSGNSTNAVVNMDSSINFTGSNSGLIVGDVGTFTPSKSGIYFGANSSLVIDASNMTSGSVLFGNGENGSLPIYVENTDSVSIDLSGWTMGTGGSLVFDVAAADEDKFEFTSSNVLQQFGINEGKIQMTVADIGEATGGTLDGSLQDVVGKVTANAGNTYVGQAFDKVFSSASGLTALNPENEQDQALIDDLKTSGVVPKGATNIIKTPFGYQYTTEDGKTVLALNGNGNKAVEEIATFPVTAGAFNATYEYLTEFNRAVEVRALEDRPEGLNRSVWAHVIATFNKSDELFGGSGYSADLYGGVLGTDVVVGGNTLVGGALTVGSGDIESRGAVIGSKNDATFYGVSLYAEHNIGAMSVKGDVTYLKTENDISSTFNGVNMGGSMDTDAISVGIRAEFKAYESDTFEVKPHLGIRYTNYSFDNYRGTDIDDVNAIESPIGVAFSGKVAATGGWTVVPELDLSVVPQLGDRKATVVNAGAGVDQTILEGAIFNAKLGLGLTKDNFSFGLNYQHGAGGFGRNNNAFQAHARWMF